MLDGKSCRVNFKHCDNCGELFTARKSHRRFCNTCNTPTNIARFRKGLVMLHRRCLDPGCGKHFTTYNKNQFACPGSKRCQDRVARIRQRYELKMRVFLGLCVRCGAEAHGDRSCGRCLEREREHLRKRRSKRKESGVCQECGSKDVLPSGYSCQDCYEKQRKRKGNGICSGDGCSNATKPHSTVCKECANRKEAERHVCKVFFRECSVCGKRFTANHSKTHTCTPECGNALKYYGKGVKLVSAKCRECGNDFKRYNKSAVNNYCSKSCSKRASSRVGKHIRRMRVREQFVEKVDIATLFMRDNGRCQACGRKLNLSRNVPHPLAATHDHIMPLSKGGENSYKNAQLLCFACNSIKRDLVSPNGTQLRLC